MRALLCNALAREVAEGPLDFLPNAGNGNQEHALPALGEVEQFIGGRALIDAEPVADQRQFGQVLDPAGPQMIDRDPDLLQRDPDYEIGRASCRERV